MSQHIKHLRWVVLKVLSSSHVKFPKQSKEFVALSLGEYILPFGGWRQEPKILDGLRLRFQESEFLNLSKGVHPELPVSPNTREFVFNNWLIYIKHIKNYQ